MKMREPGLGSSAHGEKGLVTQRWRVVRQDDNGGRFVVVEVSSEGEAARVVRDFEARGHKQVYEVERVVS